MDINLSTSVAGMKSALTSGAVRANNVANVNTRGYKSSSSVQSDSGTGGPSISAVRSDWSGGALHETGSPMDVALQGSGLFRLTTPGGSVVYSRSLHLSLNPQGRLVDASGAFPDAQQTPQVEPARIRIEQDGTIFADDAKGASVRIGRLLTVGFRNPDGLQKQGDGLLAETPASGQPIIGTGDSRVVQGYEEQANVDLATEMTGMMTDEKVLAANTKVVKTRDEMLGDILDLKA